MCVNSTLGMDSLPFNKPQIMIVFDGWEKKSYIESVKRFHDEDHMIKYLQTGAATIVKSPDELFNWINRYLENPKLHTENRKRAMKEQFYYIDGRAGRRIGEYVLSQV